MRSQSRAVYRGRVSTASPRSVVDASPSRPVLEKSHPIDVKMLVTSKEDGEEERVTVASTASTDASTIKKFETLFGEIFVFQTKDNETKVVRNTIYTGTLYHQGDCTTGKPIDSGGQGSISEPTNPYEMSALTFKITDQTKVSDEFVVCRGFVYLSCDQMYKEKTPEGCTTVKQTTLLKTFQKPISYATEMRCYIKLFEQKCPHLLRIVATNVEKMCIEMEKMSTDLMQMLKNKKTITEENLFSDVLCGMRVLHTNKLYHRDIKPENIFMDEHGVFKLADFGLSSEFGDPKDLMGSMDWTLPFETSLRCEYGYACDKYSAGLVFLVARMGHPAYRTTSVELFYKGSNAEKLLHILKPHTESTSMPWVKEVVSAANDNNIHDKRVVDYFRSEVIPLLIDPQPEQRKRKDVVDEVRNAYRDSETKKTEFYNSLQSPKRAKTRA